MYFDSNLMQKYLLMNEWGISNSNKKYLNIPKNYWKYSNINNKCVHVMHKIITCTKDNGLVSYEDHINL